MNRNEVFKSVAETYGKHKAAVDTTVQFVGIVSVAILAAQAGKKSRMAVEEAKSKKAAISCSDTVPTLTKTEMAKIYLSIYWPTMVAIGAVTAYSGKVNYTAQNKIMSVTAVAALAQQQLADFKDKTVEMIGQNKTDKVQSAVVSDKASKAITEDDRKQLLAIPSAAGVQWCYDYITDSKFLGTIQGVELAEAALIKQVSSGDGDGYATVEDWKCYINQYCPYAKLKITNEDEIRGWWMHSDLYPSATGAPDWKRDSVNPVLGPSEVMNVNQSFTTVYVSSVYNDPQILPADIQSNHWY